MKIIFDIGANKGQNLNYFLDKADIVVAFEANSNLAQKIKSDFKQFIDNKRILIVNTSGQHRNWNKIVYKVIKN